MTREEQHSILDRLLKRRSGTAAAWEHNGKLVIEEGENGEYLAHTATPEPASISWEWARAFAHMITGNTLL